MVAGHELFPTAPEASTQLMETLKAPEEGPVANGELKRLKSSNRRHSMSRTPNWSLSFLAGSKRRRLVAQRIGPVGPATEIPTDEEQVMAEHQPFSILYNEFFPKNRTVRRREIPAVKVGVKRRRAQHTIMYNFLQNLHKRSLKSVAKRVLDSDLPYEGLVAKRAFFDEDFLRKWKPVFECPCHVDLAGDHPGPPMNELAAPIKVADVAAVIASLKESSPGPDGLRLSILRGIPVEVIIIMYNLLLLKGPPPTRGKAGNIFTSQVTFIKKVEVPGDALEFRPIAIGNYFVRVFHRVLASRFEAA
ncbi:unnamed protein product [Acanthosepion pharaonis]|uniref:Uncharacterized protein n=1 Tax=Acanthosepion pharaonis TaxID=158019 RepID=A0A812DBT3_ACAPH|nr:unnamed protein product [Sepia pharaonis]